MGHDDHSIRVEEGEGLRSNRSVTNNNSCSPENDLENERESHAQKDNAYNQVVVEDVETVFDNGQIPWRYAALGIPPVQLGSSDPTKFGPARVLSPYKPSSPNTNKFQLSTKKRDSDTLTSSGSAASSSSLPRKKVTPSELASDNFNSRESTPSAATPKVCSPNGSLASTSQRKVSHSQIERRRRDKINLKLEELKQIIPECEGKDSLHKFDVLAYSIDYIRHLIKENQLLKSQLQGVQGDKPHANGVTAMPGSDNSPVSTKNGLSQSDQHAQSEMKAQQQKHNQMLQLQQQQQQQQQQHQQMQHYYYQNQMANANAQQSHYMLPMNYIEQGIIPMQPHMNAFGYNGNTPNGYPHPVQFTPAVPPNMNSPNNAPFQMKSEMGHIPPTTTSLGKTLLAASPSSGQLSDPLSSSAANAMGMEPAKTLDTLASLAASGTTPATYSHKQNNNTSRRKSFMNVQNVLG